MTVSVIMTKLEPCPCTAQVQRHPLALETWGSAEAPVALATRRRRDRLSRGGGAACAAAGARRVEDSEWRKEKISVGYEPAHVESETVVRTHFFTKQK